ncbi:AAA family ATPase [Ornithinimicrobium sp. F0845]|uniref:UvrD-helicase domain-containing protein n=1 Tax=Ornithinimicrobium sp. F0845 TaxID=2926412 RepID=UPI001FF3C089|nr:UvrD-helicase domain-containing protein [Ornithinimicrobium sp. F0845]MCK0114018.1 AAA family ATPase [Ornithinimicrobium sp. F0845]
MPTIVMAKQERAVEPILKKKAFAFLEKLSSDDTLPGLHIEPIVNSADPRVRTGRVDDGYRAVLFKIADKDAVTYVFHGIWPHDDAIREAERTTLRVNPISGIAEIRRVEVPAAETAAATGAAPEPSVTSPTPSPMAEVPAKDSLLTAYGLDVADLTGIGLDEDFAQRAMSVADEEAVLALAGEAPADWQGLALIDLSTGMSVEEVTERLSLGQAVDTTGSEEEQLIRGLQHPAGQLSFAWIEDNEELRRVIEDTDFAAWRIFLHPLQKQYVVRDYRGPAKVTGGAGTGKTVVALHRARRLALQAGAPRVLLTTFTRNLADALQRDMRVLDPDVEITSGLGERGLRIAGIDQVAHAVLKDAGQDVGRAAEEVLGVATVDVTRRTGPEAWSEAISAVGADVPENLRSPAFFAAEYTMVVLPRRITSAEKYFRAPRRGRGVALNRGQRAAVWAVIERYRASARAHGTLDFAEVATLAAAHLELSGRHLFDHVLVDEGQDLTPAHWQLLRALVPPGRNDLFIAEDSHQRIYGQKVTLSHFGIETRGRSRRLTLNYRTTQQNLRWAMGILDGADYRDLEDEAEEHDEYRSARSGPVPQVLPCESLSAELDQAAALVGSWLSEEEPPAPETVAILVRDRFQRDRVVAGLAERGVEVRAVDAESVKSGAPVVMTMHRAKGTEFARVLLFGVREGWIPSSMKEYNTSEADWDDAMLRERSLLYVAATRARDVLAVSWSGQQSTLLRGAES